MLVYANQVQTHYYVNNQRRARMIRIPKNNKKAKVSTKMPSLQTNNKPLLHGMLTTIMAALMPLMMWAQTTDITELSSITDMAGNYRITTDVSGILISKQLLYA